MLTLSSTIPVPASTSSSIQVADAIKTLDLSMPSYGEVKAPTATADTAASLSEQGKKSGIQKKASIMSEEAREAKKKEAAMSPKEKKAAAAAAAASK